MNRQWVTLIEERKPEKPADKWGDYTANSYGVPSVLAFRGPNGPIEVNGEPLMVEATFYRGSKVGRKRK